MGTIIKRFSDGSFLEYDRGSFDDWCVYYTNSPGLRRPPRDTDYFGQLRNLADAYGVDKVYGDYVAVYERTGKEVSVDALNFISNIASSYGPAQLEVDVMYSVLYMAMIADERKKYTRLGKRIKRLGIYKLLIEGQSVVESANFMRGMGWRDIAQMCEERSF